MYRVQITSVGNWQRNRERGEVKHVPYHHSNINNINVYLESVMLLCAPFDRIKFSVLSRRTLSSSKNCPHVEYKQVLNFLF